MRVHHGSDELSIHLTLEDKLNIDVFGNVSCTSQEYKKPKIVLWVVDKVPLRTTFEEPGFHIVGTPHEGGPKKRTRYDLYISKENFDDLITSSDMITGGYLLSRSLYGRVDVTYYPAMPEGAQLVLDLRSKK